MIVEAQTRLAKGAAPLDSPPSQPLLTNGPVLGAKEMGISTMLAMTEFQTDPRCMGILVAEVYTAQRGQRLPLRAFIRGIEVGCKFSLTR